MASLLPAIPTDWRATRPSHDAIRCRFGADAVTCGGPLGRWGADKREYGGVGRAANHVIRQGGVASRSHRHYGSGIVNCSAQVQPYQITDLLLSDSRPCDQLLPAPLLTNKINDHRQMCKYPSNHTYTSHRSKFAVFPLATDQSSYSRLSPLTRGTTDALSQLHHHQFCTTTYQETFTNPWPHLRSTTHHHHPSDTTATAAETSSRVAVKEDDKEQKRAEEHTASGDSVENGSRLCLENSKQSEEVGGRKCDNGEAKLSKVVKDGEQSQKNSGSRDGEEDGPKSKKKVHWEDKETGEKLREEESERECERGEVREEEKEPDAERVGEESEELKTAEKEPEQEEKAKQQDLVATGLPQLPNHFRRVSSKYCRNPLSPIWPCSIPYYLSRPRSMLQSLIPRPVILPGEFEKEPLKETRPVEERVEPMERKSGETITGPTDDVIADDVMGEIPSLGVSGSGIPQRLGIRFKTQAHSRYHQLYPDRIPDLRDSRVESKKYFFFGFHSSVLR